MRQERYFITFHKNEPLNPNELPNDYNFVQEDITTGTEYKVNPLDYEIENFDFSSIPKFEINHQESKILKVFNSSLFANLDVNNIDALTINFTVREDEFNYNEKFVFRNDKSFTSIVINITRKNTDKIFRLAFPLNSFFKKKFDDILYLRITGFSKSKLIKINLKKFKDYPQLKKNCINFIEKYDFFDEYPLGYKENILEQINLFDRFMNETVPETVENTLSKKKILQISWATAVLTSFQALFIKKKDLSDFTLKTNDIPKYEFWKTHIFNILKLEGDVLKSRKYLSELLFELSKKLKKR